MNNTSPQSSRFAARKSIFPAPLQPVHKASFIIEAAASRELDAFRVKRPVRETPDDLSLALDEWIEGMNGNIG